MTRQMNEESHKYVIAKRQRNAWTVLCGALAVYAITK